MNITNNIYKFIEEKLIKLVKKLFNFIYNGFIKKYYKIWEINKNIKSVCININNQHINIFLNNSILPYKLIFNIIKIIGSCIIVSK